MKKYSLEAQELLSQSELFEVKAGETVESTGIFECDNCMAGCISVCSVCISTMFDIILKPRPGK